ncbi:hypothetical protein CGC48_04025 [Capnocytophaga cynodegmi]|uniref:Uncharacterized protein n=1 Tax=Capnocytophaga cynodegmi TaxID=28189 RepID=A0A250E579_9FLAO|nr:hypothetical protein CGC48_04025 [Capnocytophaga cynodegmi]
MFAPIKIAMARVLNIFYLLVLCFTFFSFFNLSHYDIILSLFGILVFISVFYAHFKDYRKQVRWGLVLMFIIPFFLIFLKK